MTVAGKRSLAVRKFIFALLLAVIVLSVIFAALQNREWVAPEEARKMQNPITPTESALAAGRTVYADKCAECHGDKGKGDGPEGRMYAPAPGDLTDAKHLNARTDGELFYQISEGRKPMPAFKKRLSEQQRWQLVLFVRELARGHAATANAH